MIPFRVFDRERKEMWVILNHHPGDSGGSYLAAREDDSEVDGEMRLITPDEMVRFRLIDFLEDEGYRE